MAIASLASSAISLTRRLCTSAAAVGAGAVVFTAIALWIAAVERKRRRDDMEDAVYEMYLEQKKAQREYVLCPLLPCCRFAFPGAASELGNTVSVSGIDIAMPLRNSRKMAASQVQITAKQKGEYTVALEATGGPDEVLTPLGQILLLVLLLLLLMMDGSSSACDRCHPRQCADAGADVALWCRWISTRRRAAQGRVQAASLLPVARPVAWVQATRPSAASALGTLRIPQSPWGRSRSSTVARPCY